MGPFWSVFLDQSIFPLVIHFLIFASRHLLNCRVSLLLRCIKCIFTFWESSIPSLFYSSKKYLRSTILLILLFYFSESFLFFFYIRSSLWFSPETKWQDTLAFQNFSNYFCWTQQFSGWDNLNSSTDFKFPQVFFLVLRNCSKCFNFDQYHCCLHIPEFLQSFSFPFYFIFAISWGSKVHELTHLFLLANST